MVTAPLASSELTLRSYGGDHPVHTHDHVQLVLPLVGELEIEVDGRGERLNISRAAVIPPGAKHTQSAGRKNLALVVDCTVADANRPLMSAIYWTIPAGTQKLLAFLESSSEAGEIPERTAGHATPLLIDSLEQGSKANGATQRIRALVASNPGEQWSVSNMASMAGMSARTLHAAFRTEAGDTPGRFASKERLGAAVALLDDPSLSIAEVALRCGYSDQSALSRAMRRELGVTPGQLRRRR